MPDSPMYLDPTLTSIALTYRLANSIADRLMPRVPVEHSSFIHLADREAEWNTPIDSTISKIGQVKMIGDDHQDPTILATRDQALGSVVANRDQMNGPTESVLARRTMRLTRLIALGRELRVSALVGSTGNYMGSTALSGTSQWSAQATSDPVTAIQNAMILPYQKPNIAVCSLAVATALSQHPKVIATTLGINPGVPTIQQLANVLGLDEIIIGDSWYNAAAEGQAVNRQRLWPNIFALMYRDVNSGPDMPGTWGYTAEFGGRMAYTSAVPPGEAGLFGGVKVVTGESVREVVAQPQHGYIFTNVV